ncbi:hypothetical protein QTN25_002640 [Entamoeba marina]
MSVLDLFRTSNAVTAQELNNEVRDEEMIDYENDDNQGLMDEEGVDEETADSCLFSHFNMDEVNGYQNFVKRQGFDENWDSIRGKVVSQSKWLEKKEAKHK